MGDLYTCEYCNTEIYWEGSNDNRGTIWSCEEEYCGKAFCRSCFVEKFNINVFFEMVNENDIIRCPNCYDKFIENKWKDLTDIPVIEDEDSVLILDEDWFLWKKGTDVQDTIWHWFDNHHSKGLGWIMENIE